MEILITGGLGYLGARFAASFSKKHKVSILAHRHKKKIPEWTRKFSYTSADVTNPRSLKGVCRGMDAVIHLAAVDESECVSDPRKTYLVNCLGTQNMLEEAKASGCRRFIYLSTFHVYGSTTGKISETTLPNPTHLHGITHWVGEQLCKQYTDNKFKTFMLRCSNGIGAPLYADTKKWSLISNELCRSAVLHQKIELRTPGMQRRDFVSIADIGRAIELFLTLPENKRDDGLFNVGSGISISMRELAMLVEKEYQKMFNKKLKVIMPPKGSIGPKMSYSIEKIRSIGFIPTTDIQREVRETLAFCRDMQ